MEKFEKLLGNNIFSNLIVTKTNDLCLCLLAASKLSKIDSLIIPHGLVTTVNPWLDGYFTYQGTLNDFEKKYDDSIQIHFKASWFA